jgi:hypothetical protein
VLVMTPLEDRADRLLDGADLRHPITREERYFVDKIATRDHVEALAAKHADVGYTYIMTGLFGDGLVPFLGMSEDKKSMEFIGLPGSVVSTTWSSE